MDSSTLTAVVTLRIELIIFFMSGKIILEITRNFVRMKLKVNQGFKVCFQAIQKNLRVFIEFGWSELEGKVQSLKINMAFPHALN